MKLTAVCGDFLKTYLKPEIGSRLYMGFSAGIPYLLRLTILDLWLKESGVSNTVIGLFTFLYWPFTLKFLWAPFIERTDFPLLSKKFGRRRGWAVASQLLLFISLLGMACSSPQSSLTSLIFFASLATLGDGIQDMSLYAFQIDKTKAEMFGPIAGAFIFGYRSGMFFAKSVSLYLAHSLSWNMAYAIMAFSIFLCTFFVLHAEEPDVVPTDEMNRIEKIVKIYEKRKSFRFEFLRILNATLLECLVCPFKMFIKRKHSLLLISVIVLYRAGDKMAQKMAKLFYVDIGFSKLEIANVVQVFGAIASLIGGIIGGYFVKKYGVKRAMLMIGAAHALSCFAYVLMSKVGYNISMLYFTVFVENITGGAIATAFVAFLYSLCNKTYATTQYALLWAFYEFGGTICRALSGAIADALGWTNFFLFVPITFIPSLAILYFLLTKEKLSFPVEKSLKCETI